MFWVWGGVGYRLGAVELRARRAEGVRPYRG